MSNFNVSIYTIHDKTRIHGFNGEYDFLSNFSPCLIEYKGMVYESSEHAYQAQKVPIDRRRLFTVPGMTAAKAKKAWKGYSMYTEEQWDMRKYNIMREIVFEKFNQSGTILDKLLDTGDRHLEETNHWSDRYWGVDYRWGGLNNLGLILMKVRQFFQ